MFVLNIFILLPTSLELIIGSFIPIGSRFIHSSSISDTFKSLSIILYWYYHIYHYQILRIEGSMLFHIEQKQIDPLHINIDNINIDRDKQFNFLGLTINENLTWTDHINKIANKISQNLGILNKLKYLLPIKVKTIIYNSLILSHINFRILAWGYKCDRITKLQKRAVRIISISKHNSHTEPLLKELKLLKVEDILKLKELKFYYKFKHSNLPNYLNNVPSNKNKS